MLERWLTSRCWREDAPLLTTAKGGLIKFLEVQDQRASGTEPFAAAERPGTFTYHFGQGRGVCWQEVPRRLLWLCAFADVHDRGYARAERLQQAGALYPDVGQHASAPGNPRLPWGSHADDDAYEWARAIYGALETWEIDRAALASGGTISYPSALYMELSKDRDDIWTLVIRRRLTYLDGAAAQRERWLTNGEIHAVFHQLAGEPDPLNYEFENPPHPKAFLFAQVHFLDGPLAPATWLHRVCAAAIAGDPAPLVTGSR